MELPDLIVFLLERFSLPIAGALGGIIRWVSLQSPWRAGIGHVAIGAIIGNYFGPAVFIVLQQPAATMGMLPADAAALGAHVAGAFGPNIYTVPTDFFRGWRQAMKASSEKEPST